MHTIVELDAGVLSAQIVSEEPTEVSARRWRAAILPATLLLRALGGGAFLLPHCAQDLRP